MADAVLAQHLTFGALWLLDLAPARLREIEESFGGPGPLGDFDCLAEWCAQNPAQAHDLLLALRDALGDNAFGIS